MSMKKLLALVLCLVMVLGLFAGCGSSKEDPTTTPTTAPTTPSDNNNNDDDNEDEKPTEPSYVPEYIEGEPEYQDVDVNDAVVHKDYTSVYEKIGSKVNIDMVDEDYDTGLATVEYEGKTYELGMDFLSMAMVYNTAVPEGSKYANSEEIFNQWWKLYIQRWNYLAAEVPLYSNQYFDLYNAKIENFVTTPYWAAADAIVSATIKSGESNSVILGSSTDLSGAFRSSAWGKSSPGSSDLDIENLTTGHSTLQTDKSGSYVWNMNTLAEKPVAVMNDDGTLTYTVKVKEGLLFSDGSAINAKNYIAGVLARSTPVAVAAGDTGASGLYFVGFDAFKAYDGTNDGADASKYFTGVKLLDDYTFSVTIVSDYANYYYSMAYAGFSPVPMALYLGSNDIIVAEDGSCGLSDGFYAKAEKNGAEVYTMADVIINNLKWDSDLPWSGPYTVEAYDASALKATLKLNPYYTSDVRGKATIETISYVRMVTETQMDMFTSGQIDVLAGITGAAETEAALALVEKEPNKYAETHYDRAGYGKIGFRGDLGPTNFVEVRQAIMYTINRPEFAQAFTGGYGTVVHGPYYTGYSAYKAVEDEIVLNPYTYSSDDAIEVLANAGWVYNNQGKEFVPGVDDVRYKKLSGFELSPQNLNYSSVDGKYKTLKINGNYYMPLAVNWYGTQPNDVTDLLLTAWQSNPNATSEIGMYITYTSCDFTSGLYGEYLQIPEYGWDGVAKLCAINFATGFTSAVYDYSFGWTIDQDMYADYSQYYIMDEADFWENY